MGSIESYRSAARLYDRIYDNHPEVLREMRELIDALIDTRDEFYNNWAGKTLLPKHKRFREVCGDKAAPVFGILLKEYLATLDWKLDDKGNGLKRYYRP